MRLMPDRSSFPESSHVTLSCSRGNSALAIRSHKELKHFKQFEVRAFLRRKVPTNRSSIDPGGANTRFPAVCHPAYANHLALLETADLTVPFPAPLFRGECRAAPSWL